MRDAPAIRATHPRVRWRTDCDARRVGFHGPPRLAGFAYTGPDVYLVTCCTFKRAVSFLDNTSVTSARASLLQLACDHLFAVDAYCFMPDHVHVVATGLTQTSDLRRFVDVWKQRTGWDHKRTRGTRLWQGGYHDRVLRDDADRLDVIGYVIANPIRAGLVANVEDYPHWGSSVWTRSALIEALQRHAAGA